MSDTIFPMDIDRENFDIVRGYSYAIKELMKWIEDETQFDPAKRHIDSVKILDGIGAACSEIKSAMEKIEAKLQNDINTLNDIPKNLFIQPENT